MQGLVTAIYEIGCLLGAMFILGVGDLLGRRRAIILGAIIMLLGVIIQVTSISGASPLAQFIVGRVVMGVGNGINTSTIPTYQGENLTNTANKYFNANNRGSRVQQNIQPRPSHLHRGQRYCFRDPDRLLDRLRRLIWGRRPCLAFPHCLPGHLRPPHLYPHDLPSGVTQMAP